MWLSVSVRPFSLSCSFRHINNLGLQILLLLRNLTGTVLNTQEKQYTLLAHHPYQRAMNITLIPTRHLIRQNTMLSLLQIQKTLLFFTHCHCNILSWIIYFVFPSFYKLSLAFPFSSDLYACFLSVFKRTLNHRIVSYNVFSNFDTVLKCDWKTNLT